MSHTIHPDVYSSVIFFKYSQSCAAIIMISVSNFYPLQKETPGPLVVTPHSLPKPPRCGLPLVYFLSL